MPSSHWNQISTVVAVLTWLKPEKILDVGAGYGKYGVLAREYLELWDGREEYHERQRRIDAIEGFASYVTPLHEFIYDHVYVTDAQAAVDGLECTYDLALLVDVLEHFQPEDGRRLLTALLEHCGTVLVCTPTDEDLHGGCFDNELEAHLSHWRHADLKAFGPCVRLPADDSLICVLGAGADTVRRAAAAERRRRWRTRARRWLRGGA